MNPPQHLIVEMVNFIVLCERPLHTTMCVDATNNVSPLYGLCDNDLLIK